MTDSLPTTVLSLIPFLNFACSSYLRSCPPLRRNYENRSRHLKPEEPFKIGRQRNRPRFDRNKPKAHYTLLLAEDHTDDGAK